MEHNRDTRGRTELAARPCCRLHVMWLPLWVFIVGLPWGTSDTFRVLYLSQWQRQDEGSFTALQLALENYRMDYNDTTLLHQHEFQFELRSEVCDYPALPSEVLIEAALSQNLDVVMGPFCSLMAMSTSFVMYHWRIPVFPDSAPHYDLHNKTMFPNVIRVNTGMNKMGLGALAVMQWFGWHQAAIYSGPNVYCDYGALSIDHELILHGVHVTEWLQHLYHEDQDIPLAEVEAHLLGFKDRTRIIWLCHSTGQLVTIMQTAQRLGMTNGDYVFLYYMRHIEEGIPLDVWNDDSGGPRLTDEQIQQRRASFYPLKLMSVWDSPVQESDGFLREVGVQLCTTMGLCPAPEGRGSSIYLHDAMYLYLMILDELLIEGIDPRNNGDEFFERSKQRYFRGMSGRVEMDNNGDRHPDWQLWFNGPDTEQMVPWLQLHLLDNDTYNATEQGLDVYWGTTDNQVPPDVPICGFHDEYCTEENTGLNIAIPVSVTIVVVFTLIGVAVGIIYRILRQEQELQRMLWRIRFEDIKMPMKKVAASSVSLLSNSTRHTLDSSNASELDEDGMRHSQTTLGIYKGNMVAMRMLAAIPRVLTRDNLVELKMIRELNNDNINGFVGACIDPPNMCIVTQYCNKGTLQDILENDDIKLDWMFKCSLIADIVKGMSYIHQSFLGSHGSLRSSNCLIDSRWQVKLTSIGLQFLKKEDQAVRALSEYQLYRRRLWMAPELLRLSDDLRPASGSKAGDVYSFAIIMQEILFRALPYFMDKLSPKEVVELVATGVNHPYRPELPKDSENLDPNMVDLMRSCWHERPNERPDFVVIKRRIISINKGRKFNMIDNMIQKLEKYANNLEEIVNSRTVELMEEKKKSERLLHLMLPPVVADMLKAGNIIPAEMFDDVTVYFSDVVGFTELSSQSSPMQVVDLLNDLYTLFDGIINKYDVYKVETIGDAYMVASGLPERNGDHHAGEIATMSLDLLSAVFTSFRIRHHPDRQLLLRIGLHTGSCAAGVVGQTMPRYCLFGDTVNMASRMESNSLPYRIHLSCDANTALGRLPGYRTVLRGDMMIKGKGIQKTHWLVGKEGFTGKLPPMDTELTHTTAAT